MLDSSTIESNPISVKPPPPTIKLESDFDQILAKVNDSLMTWGFNERSEKLYTSIDDFKKHWFIKRLFKKVNTASAKKRYPYLVFPSSTDWANLEKIRQVSFKKGWKIIIEEWTFADDKSADKWLDIAFSANRSNNEKPPCSYWTDGNKMYIIMATSSHDWSVYGVQLVEQITGKTKNLIRLLNKPIELKAFKKRAGGANGGPRKMLPYYYKPDTIGTYYGYFWFHDLRRRNGTSESESVNDLHVLTYIYGEKVGWYNKVDEELISLRCKVPYSGLQGLDFVGLSKTTIENKLGKSSLEKKGCSIYYHNKSFLLIHFLKDEVDWFRYIKTKFEKDQVNELPDNLFEYEGNS